LMVFIFIKEPKIYESAEEQPGMFKSLAFLAQEQDKSGLRILLAIFFWFLAYSAIEAFFTLYSKNYLGIGEANGARLLSQLSLVFIIFALPAGFIGARIGRRLTIMMGILVMMVVMLAIYIIPVSTLITQITKLPVLGVVPVIGLLLMVAGAGWALININSLPMVVDLTTLERVGTYTGLYYLFSTLSAIVGPNINGWLIKLTGDNYNSIMVLAAGFMLVALVLMVGVKRGEAVDQETPAIAVEG
jgi:maltose/moltooligosaccharide transporter